MNLTAKSLRTEMRNSAIALSLRIDKLDTNLNGRIDQLDTNLNVRIDQLNTDLNVRIDVLSLKLDGHIKQTKHEFRNIDERFSGIDRRFKKIDQRFDNIDRRFDRLTGEIIDALSGYFTNIERMVANHEDRIVKLEQKH